MRIYFILLLFVSLSCLTDLSYALWMLYSLFIRFWRKLNKRTCAATFWKPLILERNGILIVIIMMFSFLYFMVKSVKELDNRCTYRSAYLFNAPSNVITVCSVIWWLTRIWVLENDWLVKTSSVQSFQPIVW